MIYIISMKPIFMLFLVGVTLAFMGYWKSNYQCGPPKILYKYIPRTFLEEQTDPVKPSEIYRTMFHDETQPWFNSYLLPISTERSTARLIAQSTGNSGTGMT